VGKKKSLGKDGTSTESKENKENREKKEREKGMRVRRRKCKESVAKTAAEKIMHLFKALCRSVAL